MPDRKGMVGDSIAAIDYVVGRGDVEKDRIVLFGQSMGGQLAINAAANSKAPGIQLVISEATYARHSYHISDKIGQFGPLWLVKWGASLLTSDDFCGEYAIAQLGSTPVLLVHGSSDSGVSPYHSDRLFAAASEPKDIWRYDGCEHLQIFTNEENQQRLVEYIREKLGHQSHGLTNNSVSGGQTDEPEPK